MGILEGKEGKIPILMGKFPEFFGEFLGILGGEKREKFQFWWKNSRNFWEFLRGKKGKIWILMEKIRILMEKFLEFLGISGGKKGTIQF